MGGGSTSLGTKRIAALVRDVNAAVEQHRRQAAVEVGRLVLNAVYSGDYEAYRSKDPTKASSLQQLLEHDELAVSQSYIRQAIHVAHQVGAMGPGFEELSLRQHRALIPLGTIDEKKVWATRAVEEGWGGRKLEEEIKKTRENSGRTGRPPRGPAGRFLVELREVMGQARARSVFQAWVVEAPTGELTDLHQELCAVHLDSRELIRLAALELSERLSD